MVRNWPTGTRLYRRLGDNAFAAYKGTADKPGDTGPTGPGGGADLVETKIDNAALKGTDLKVAYTLDIEFAYDLKQANARDFCDLGDPAKAVQTMIATVLRGNGRTITGNFGLDIDTPENRVALEQSIKDLLIRANATMPVTFIKVTLGTMEIGTPEYRASIQKNATDLAAATSRSLLLAQLQLNAEAENTPKTTIASGWKAQMEAVGCADYQCLWIILYGTENAPYYNGQNLQQQPPSSNP